jgi:hypothetical protein
MAAIHAYFLTVDIYDALRAAYRINPDKKMLLGALPGD